MWCTIEYEMKMNILRSELEEETNSYKLDYAETSLTGHIQQHTAFSNHRKDIIVKSSVKGHSVRLPSLCNLRTEVGLDINYESKLTLKSHAERQCMQTCRPMRCNQL